MQIKNKFTKLTNTERIFNNKETMHQMQSLVVMLIHRVISNETVLSMSK